MNHKLVGYIILAVFLCSIVFLRQYTYLQLTTREPTNQMSIRTIEADFVNTTTEWPERDLLGDSVQERELPSLSSSSAESARRASELSRQASTARDSPAAMISNGQINPTEVNPAQQVARPPSAVDVPDAQLEKLPTMQRKQQPPPSLTESSFERLDCQVDAIPCLLDKTETNTDKAQQLRSLLNNISGNASIDCCSSIRSPIADENTPVIEILSFSTFETVDFLVCFLLWIEGMMTQDKSASYILRVRLAGHRFTHGSNGMLSESWKFAVRGKVQMLHERLKRPHQWLLFSDLDVVPIRAYSRLLSHAHTLITWMAEPAWSGSGSVNTGFYLIRPQSPLGRRHTQLVDFFKLWLAGITESTPKNQPVANRLMGCNYRSLVKNCTGGVLLSWSKFSWRIVTGNLFKRRKKGPAIAYHAIAKDGTKGKFAAFKKTRTGSVSETGECQRQTHWHTERRKQAPLPQIGCNATNCTDLSG